MFRTIAIGINRISEWSGLVAALVVIPLVLALTYEVVSRYFFGSPTIWAYELSYFMTGTILMLGLSYALKHKQHVNVDVLHSLLPPRGRALVDLIGYTALLAVCIPFTAQVAGYALQAFWSGEVSGSSAWSPVIWPFRSIWAVGLVLFCLQLLSEIIQAIAIVVGIAEERSGS